MDGEGVDSNSLDNELPVRSRKVPESSRTAESVPRENRLGSTSSQTTGAPSQRARRDMQIPDELNLDDEAVDKLQHAMQHPPVTVKTLYELELVCILGNVNLRVDVNFDHDLHFMPVKGRRGDEKREQAQTYWAALALELQIYIFTARQVISTTRPKPKVFWQRLPQMFEDLKELLLTLIPDVEADRINQTLDVPLLMQQVEKGVLDIGRLARWLANLVKNHCAPMRDAWADEMVKMVEDGLAMHDTTQIVAGLEKLFGILEAMKLVSNRISSTSSLLTLWPGCGEPSNPDFQIVFDRGYCQIPAKPLPQEDSRRETGPHGLAKMARGSTTTALHMQREYHSRRSAASVCISCSWCYLGTHGRGRVVQNPHCLSL